MNREQLIEAYKKWFLTMSMLPVHVSVLWIAGMSAFFPEASETPAIVGPIGWFLLIVWIIVMPLMFGKTHSFTPLKS